MKTLNAMLNDALTTHIDSEFLNKAIPLLAYDVVNGKADLINLDWMMTMALSESETEENEYMVKEFLNRFNRIKGHMDRNDKTEEDFIRVPHFNPALSLEDQPKPSIDKDSRLYKAWLERDESYGKMSDFKPRLQKYIDENKG